MQASTNTKYWSNVYQKLGVDLPDNSENYLKKKDEKRETAKRKKVTFKYKRRRRHNQNAKMLSEIKALQVIERENLGTYGAGAAFGDETETNRGRKRKETATCRCGSMEHKRINHRSCPMNPKNKPKGPVAIVDDNTIRNENKKLKFCEYLDENENEDDLDDGKS